MLNTQMDVENYIYAEVNKNIGHLIGTPLDNSMKLYFDYLAKNIEKQLSQLIPMATLAPDIEISTNQYDPTIINIKITPKPYPYQYSFSYNVFNISEKNMQTHNIGCSSAYISSSYSIKCGTCGYKIHKDSSGYFSDIGDFSCDEYIIKDIIE